MRLASRRPGTWPGLASTKRLHLQLAGSGGWSPALVDVEIGLGTAMVCQPDRSVRLAGSEGRTIEDLSLTATHIRKVVVSSSLES